MNEQFDQPYKALLRIAKRYNHPRHMNIDSVWNDYYHIIDLINTAHNPPAVLEYVKKLFSGHHAHSPECLRGPDVKPFEGVVALRSMINDLGEKELQPKPQTLLPGPRLRLVVDNTKSGVPSLP